MYVAVSIALGLGFLFIVKARVELFGNVHGRIYLETCFLPHTFSMILKRRCVIRLNLIGLI